MIADKSMAKRGLIFAPYLSGERSPHWRSGAKGSIIGLTLHTTPEEIYGAILEGVAMQFKEAMDIIETSLVKMDQITISGGAVDLGSHLAFLLAHILERPLHYPLNKEVTCRGVGIYAMHLTGAISSLNDVIIDKGIIEPNSYP
jgi:xylulokinase